VFDLYLTSATRTTTTIADDVTSRKSRDANYVAWRLHVAGCRCPASLNLATMTAFYHRRSVCALAVDMSVNLFTVWSLAPTFSDHNVQSVVNLGHVCHACSCVDILLHFADASSPRIDVDFL